MLCVNCFLFLRSGIWLASYTSTIAGETVKFAVMWMVSWYHMATWLGMWTQMMYVRFPSTPPPPFLFPHSILCHSLMRTKVVSKFREFLLFIQLATTGKKSVKDTSFQFIWGIAWDANLALYNPLQLFNNFCNVAGGRLLTKSSAGISN